MLAYVEAVLRRRESAARRILERKDGLPSATMLVATRVASLRADSIEEEVVSSDSRALCV